MRAWRKSRKKSCNDNYRNSARDHQLPLLNHWANWQKVQQAEPEKFKTGVADGTHPSDEGSLAVIWPLMRAFLAAGANGN